MKIIAKTKAPALAVVASLALTACGGAPVSNTPQDSLMSGEEVRAQQVEEGGVKVSDKQVVTQEEKTPVTTKAPTKKAAPAPQKQEETRERVFVTPPKEAVKTPKIVKAEAPVKQAAPAKQTANKKTAAVAKVSAPATAKAPAKKVAASTAAVAPKAAVKAPAKKKVNPSVTVSGKLKKKGSKPQFTVAVKTSWIKRNTPVRIQVLNGKKWQTVKTLKASRTGHLSTTITTGKNGATIRAVTAYGKRSVVSKSVKLNPNPKAGYPKLPKNSVYIPKLKRTVAIDNRYGKVVRGSLTTPKNTNFVRWQAGPKLNATRGNTVLASHVNWGRQVGVLKNQASFKGGDIIYTSDERGNVRKYKLLKRTINKKSNLPREIFQTKGGHRLILVSCGGKFISKKRSYDSNIILHYVPLD